MTSSPIYHRFRCLATASLFLWSLTGDRPMATTAAAQPSNTAAAQESGDGAGEESARETWEAFYIAGRHTGFRVTRVSLAVHRDRVLREISAREHLRILRSGQRMIVDVTSMSRESSNGAVQSFSWEERVSSGRDSPVRVRGMRAQVEDGQIAWERTGATTEVDAQPTRSTDWPSGGGGYFALEQSLRRRPLQPGEVREITTLMPLLDRFVATKLTARDQEITELLDSDRELLRVDAVAKLPGGVRLMSILWCDQRGEILKSQQPMLKLTAYRTSKQLAQAISASPADLFQQMIVPIDPPVAGLHNRQQATYEIELRGGSPERAFVSDQRQRWIQQQPAKSPCLEVRAVGPDFWRSVADGKEPAAAQPPLPALEPSQLIDFQAREVRQLARRVAARREDPWAVSLELERLVAETVTEKNLASMLAPASAVAASREGDCTEHAVLLAALCRAHQIPARVTVGLVYVERAGGFLYHMWNEVWIAGTWRPLDATLSQGGVGPAHLKITDSFLENDAEYASFLPILNVIGQLEIGVVGWQ